MIYTFTNLASDNPSSLPTIVLFQGLPCVVTYDETRKAIYIKFSDARYTYHFTSNRHALLTLQQLNAILCYPEDSYPELFI